MPTDLIDYMKLVISSKSKRYLGHNPASSYAAVLMFLFAFGLGFLGLMMSLRISKHFFEEVHELLANGFLIIVILHIAGVILHQIKHHDGMIWGMIDGKKAKIDDTDELKSNHPLVALVFIGLFLFTGNYLYRSFDENTGKIDIFGIQVRLGEKESRVNSVQMD